MKFLEIIKRFMEEHPYGILGGFCGMLLGLLIISFGILNTLILIILCSIGFFIGKRISSFYK